MKSSESNLFRAPQFKHARYEVFRSEKGLVNRLCQQPKTDAMKPILAPKEPWVRFIRDAAILFCSKIPCITSVPLKNSLFTAIRLINKNDSGESFCGAHIKI